MAKKVAELRPVMVRLPETLRRRVEREAERNGRSMNTEIIYRLEQTFSVAGVDLREQVHWVRKKIDAAKDQVSAAELDFKKNLEDLYGDMNKDVNSMRDEIRVLRQEVENLRGSIGRTDEPRSQ